ncbi:FMN-binding negative transcriptional regulator [Acinetobacter sp. MD2]|uniref:FMN-binding negative transcriptional regulator n=1 Tax=Acinetobacter sp. MD2 TaxID=2600066 RepID=UPI002D78B087|nr:FMN-binding negative transcriptional regulator [Acinetobacter sp. MD2]
MYQVRSFAEHNPNVLLNFIQQHPLGTLITLFSGEPNADHLPFWVRPCTNSNPVLQAHIAKANPLYQQLLQHGEAEVLVIFQANSHYISPNWYPEKAIHHKVVPTWNYQAVHAKGKLRLMQDQTQLFALLQQLTDQEEAKLRQNNPWQVTDAPQAYLTQMLEHIIGIEIEISELIGKFKMSQNKATDTQAAVQQGLRQQAQLQHISN